jgi:hypothetical protein
MKEISEIIKFIDENLPEELNEISSSIELLQEILNKTRNKINHSILDLTKANKHEEAREFLDKSEELSGFIKIIDQVNEEIAAITKEEVKKGDIPDYERYYVDNTKTHYLNEDYTFKRPYAFVLKENGAKVSTWVQMLLETCKILIEIDDNLFRAFTNDKDFKGRSRSYLSYEIKSMNKPEKIELHEEDIYVETNLSANDIIRIIRKMIKKYGIGIKEYKIYLKADYSDLHK